MAWHYPETLAMKDAGRSRWYWKLNGMSYGQVPEMHFGSQAFSIPIKVFLSSLPVAGKGTLVAGAILFQDEIVIDVDATQIRAFCYVGSSLQGIATFANPADNEIHEIEVTWDGVKTATVYLDGSPAATAEWRCNGNQNISYVGSRQSGAQTGTSNFTSYIVNIGRITGIDTAGPYLTGTALYELTEGYSAGGVAVESDNTGGATNMQKLNDSPEDYTQDEPGGVN